MIRWSAVAPGLLVAASGCLATKSDIELLQTEARTSRSQSSQGVAAILHADSVRGRQIAQLSATLDRLTDSLRVLTTRFNSFQATTTGEFDTVNQQLVQFQALLGQTTRTVQDTRAQIDALRDQATSSATAPPTGAPGDSSRRPNVPGAATLYTTANEQLKAGSYRTARTGFETLLATYPQYEYASAALLKIGDSYKNERNSPAADSVYQLVVQRYPNSPDAATALYKHGKFLWDDPTKKAEGREVLNRVIKDYPRSSEADLARNLVKP